jgi:hypothetical protein
MQRIQDSFLSRAENLLRQHQQRSHIHDGLKNLSNQEIMYKITESPNKLKARAKSLLYFLRKNNVRLDERGEIDYERLQADKDARSVAHVVRKQEQLVKLVLMQKDLEFEYPQKIEKIKVRADLLKWLDEEEDRVRRNLSEGILELDEEALSGKTAKKIDVMAGYVLTYEDYYELDDFVGDGGKKKAQMGKIPYEEFAA